MTFKNNFIWDNMALDWGLELENVLYRSFFRHCPAKWGKCWDLVLLSKYEIQGPKKTYIYRVFWGGNTGNYLENYIKYEKNQNMGPYTGYFRGKMPCNLHQIRWGSGNKRAKVVQLINVNRTSYMFGLEKWTLVYLI